VELSEWERKLINLLRENTRAATNRKMAEQASEQASQNFQNHLYGQTP
jgi:hypothetical protein